MPGLSVGPSLRQYVIVTTVNLGVFSFGLSLGWSSPVLVKLKNPSETCLVEPLTASHVSWIVAGGFLASIFAMFIPSLLMDYIGRKRCMILSYVPHIVACVLFLVATRAWMLILGRVLTGISLSLIYSVSPSYVAEIASKERRGALGTIFQISCCTGILIMLSVGPFVSYFALSTMYLVIVVLAAVPSLFLPDSPYFLYSKGKTEEALNLLILLRGSESLAEQEIEEYKQADGDKKFNKSSLAKDTVFLKTVAIVMTFAILGHFSGASAIVYYMQSIFESTKTNVSPEVSSAVIGAIKVISTIFSACTTDKFGRKPILIWTWMGKSIGMIGLGTYFYLRNPEMNVIFNYIPILCIVLIIFCHNAGQNSVIFVMIAELFEGPSRAVGVTSAMFAGTVANFVMALFLSDVLSILGPSITYWSFGVVSAGSVLFIKFFLPETKGKSFAEIQEKLGRRRKGLP